MAGRNRAPAAPKRAYRVSFRSSWPVGASDRHGRVAPESAPARQRAGSRKRKGSAPARRVRTANGVRPPCRKRVASYCSGCCVDFLISFSQNFLISLSATPGFAACTCRRQSCISACVLALLLRALWSELVESGLSCCGAALGAGSAVVGGGVVCANAAVAATSAVKANVAPLTGYLLVMGHAQLDITLKTRDSRPGEASSREW
jgi:hypothetical protein